VQPSARLAKELALNWFFMVNLAALDGNYQDGVKDNPRRYNNGKIWAPTDSIYWTRVVENRFLRVANLCRGEQYRVDGFLIDPEMYLLDSAKPTAPDFGDYAMQQFLHSQELKFEYLNATIRERKNWLVRNRLMDELLRFQFDAIKKMALRTRQRLQAVVPGAILGFFMWRNNIWFKAVAAGFATEQTPCFVGPELTYPGGFSILFLRYSELVKKQAGVPILYVPGLDLSHQRAMAAGKALTGNLYHRCINSDGYYFWSLQRSFDTAAPEPVLKLLSKVNAELDKYEQSDGRYSSPLRAKAFPYSEIKAILGILK
jgi:hypothetical protein